MQTELLQSQVDGKLHWHPLISSCSHTLFPMFHYRTVPRGLAMTHYVHQPIELPCKEDLSEHIGFSLNSSVSRSRKLGPGTMLPYTAVHACMVRKSELRHGLKGQKDPPPPPSPHRECKDLFNDAGRSIYRVPQRYDNKYLIKIVLEKSSQVSRDIPWTMTSQNMFSQTG